MMKRMFSFILALVMGVSLTACGTGTETGSESEDTVKKETAQVSDEEKASESSSDNDITPSSETAQETENTEASEVVQETEPSAAISDYNPEHFETDTLTWEFDSTTGTLSIHGEGPMRDYSGEAPEWEQYKEQILTVTMDEGVTSVGAYAFYNYLYLTEVRLPDSVEEIDVSAFDYDWSLRTVNIPASLKYVGSRAFYNTLLWEPADLVFPEGCEYIGDEAFHSALKSGGIVSLPSTLKYLGSQSFTNAFLSDFIVAADNEYYYSDNHAIYTKDMKEMLMLAPIAAHSGEYRIPDGVERISVECFNVIQGIETVYIPASVTEIEEMAFFSTFDLKEIIVDEANPNYKSENGMLLSKDGTLLLAFPDGIETNELVIPEGVERIGAYLFYGRTEGSYSVILPESIREIGTMSLPCCMTSITLPASLKTIDKFVFYSGISVESITYNGTAADWENITIEDGNVALDSAVINMN
ncbi:MAG: leucine-rich repeat domain-containing protein [Clostridia bacterium]|nr:leucine-rich repeat domain-containing protein [Clostridia bacterium]